MAAYYDALFFTPATNASSMLELAGANAALNLSRGYTRYYFGYTADATSAVGNVTVKFTLPAAGWTTAPLRVAGKDSKFYIGHNMQFAVDATALGTPAAGAPVTVPLISTTDGIRACNSDPAGYAAPAALELVAPANGAADIPVVRPGHTAFFALDRDARWAAVDNAAYRDAMVETSSFPQEVAFAWQGGTGSVLSVRQTLAPREGAAVLATFGDGSPAIVRGSAGKGRIYCAGMLPALDYIRKALDARFALEELARTNAAALPPEAAVMLERSYNPWEYPAATRDLITTPVREAGVVCPVRCSVPLVDAVYMPHEKGILVPLANYVNTPLTNVTLNVEVAGEVERVESARRGGLQFRQQEQQVELNLPLDENDFVKILYRQGSEQEGCDSK